MAEHRSLEPGVEGSTPSTRSMEKALIVAVPQNGEVCGTLVAGTYNLITDINDNLGSMYAEDSLGEPPSAGVWVWEGRLKTIKSLDGDYDVDYVGKYRKATDDEISKIVGGEQIIDWVVPKDDDESSAKESNIDWLSK